MNPIIVFLMVILLLVIFFLIYRAIFPPTTTLSTQQNLINGNVKLEITDGKASSGNVSYAVWVYVNTWQNSGKKIIFSRIGDLALYLDANTPTLYCDITIVPVTGSTPKDNSYNTSNLITNGSANNTCQTVMITSNYPIQKWVYIIVSFDTAGFADFYLDGKLVKSVQLYNFRPSLPDQSTSIIIGGTQNYQNPYDAYVNQFVRYTYTMDPQTAWNLYLYGNGSFFGQYNVDVALLKNGVVQSDYKLF